MDQTVIKIDKEIIVQLYIFILTYRNLIIVVIMRLEKYQDMGYILSNTWDIFQI